MKTLSALFVLLLFFSTSAAQFVPREAPIVADPIQDDAEDIQSGNLFHYDIYAGAFVPTHEMKLIGTKPLLGLSFGINNQKMTYDLTLEFRFGKSKEEYQLSNGLVTDNYVGGYLGVDMLREIAGNEKSTLLVLGGVGLDLFEIEPAEYRDPTTLEYIFLGDEEILTKRSRNIFSYNLNLGAMYRIRLKANTYLGWRYRYNIVNYNSRKINTDVSGNFHTITLSFGGFTRDPY